MSFFPERIDEREPEPEKEWAQPAWMGAPDDVLAGVVPLELVLGRSEVAVVALTGMRGYPSGLAMTLAVRSRGPVGRRDLDAEALGARPAGPGRWRGAQLAALGRSGLLALAAAAGRAPAGRVPVAGVRHRADRARPGRGAVPGRRGAFSTDVAYELTSGHHRSVRVDDGLPWVRFDAGGTGGRHPDYLHGLLDAGSYLGMDRFGLDLLLPTDQRVPRLPSSQPRASPAG